MPRPSRTENLGKQLEELEKTKQRIQQELKKAQEEEKRSKERRILSNMAGHLDKLTELWDLPTRGIEIERKHQLILRALQVKLSTSTPLESGEVRALNKIHGKYIKESK